MKKIKKSFWISSLVCFIPSIIALFFYDRLPDRIATHFNANNIPDSYSSKPVALFLIPTVLVIANIIVWIAVENDPKKENLPKQVKSIVKWIVPTLAIVVESAIIIYALAPNSNIFAALPGVLGVFITITGYFFRTLKHNYTVGIRLPWTLASEENWDKTHKFASKFWMSGGVLIVASAFFQDLWTYVTLGIVIIISIIPTAYSFLLYRKTQ